MKTTSAASLMCSSEWSQWHFRMEHIDFLNQCWSKRTILHVGEWCFVGAA